MSDYRGNIKQKICTGEKGYDGRANPVFMIHDDYECHTIWGRCKPTEWSHVCPASLPSIMTEVRRLFARIYR